MKKAILISGLAALTAAASAQTMPPPEGVLHLQASASVDVPNDQLSITFSTTHEGADAASVQAALKQALDAALAEARKVAKPEQVDVQAGNFSVHPRYDRKGQPVGWSGRSEMVVEGRDMATIAKLTGRIRTMAIARVAYGLSRQAREKVEAEVTAQAISRYRARAAELSRQFGYQGYTIREVHVSAHEPPPRPMMAREMTMAAAKEDAPLPVEPGSGTVTAHVNGAVQMK